MLLVGIGMVKNECDVIEQFVRHTLTYLDRLVLLDNASTDGTREMLQAMMTEGLSLQVFDDPILKYTQADKMTALLHRVVATYSPDAVFPLDADEFLIAPSRGALEAALAGLPHGVAGSIRWTTYLYSSGEPPSRPRWGLGGPKRQAATATSAASLDDPIRRMTRRRRVEEPCYEKVVLTNGLADQSGWSDLRLAPGNHAVAHVASGPVPAQELEGVRLAHFPVRGHDQLASKVIGGWLAYLAKDPQAGQQDSGYQKRNLYERLVTSGDVRWQTDRELEAISLGYAQLGDSAGAITDENSVIDPIVITYARRYAALMRPNPLTTLARSFERYLTNVEARDTAPVNAARR